MLPGLSGLINLLNLLRSIPDRDRSVRGSSAGEHVRGALYQSRTQATDACSLPGFDSTFVLSPSQTVHFPRAWPSILTLLCNITIPECSPMTASPAAELLLLICREISNTSAVHLL